MAKKKHIICEGCLECSHILDGMVYCTHPQIGGSMTIKEMLEVEKTEGPCPYFRIDKELIY